MKIFFFTSLCITLSFLKANNAIAQSYQPMAIEGAHWVINSDRLSTPWLDEKFVFSIRADTLVNNKTYKKVYRDIYEFDESRKIFLKNIVNSSLFALMRDDTLQQKVYAIMGKTAYDSCTENEEYLLFDFSLNKGDTLLWCSLTEFRFDPGQPQIVDSTSIIDFHPTGDRRKSLYALLPFLGYLDSTPAEESMPIVEGFGFEHYGPFIVGTSVEKYCVGTLAECELVTDIEDILLPDIRIFPNPANEYIIVDIKNQKEVAYQYQIFSVEGKMMKEGQIHNDRIAIQDLPNGLFYLFISSDKKGPVLIEKILINH